MAPVTPAEVVSSTLSSTPAHGPSGLKLRIPSIRKLALDRAEGGERFSLLFNLIWNAYCNGSQSPSMMALVLHPKPVKGRQPSEIAKARSARQWKKPLHHAKRRRRSSPRSSSTQTRKTMSKSAPPSAWTADTKRLRRDNGRKWKWKEFRRCVKTTMITQDSSMTVPAGLQ